jgi:hypothetical protein
MLVHGFSVSHADIDFEIELWTLKRVASREIGSDEWGEI